VRFDLVPLNAAEAILCDSRGICKRPGRLFRQGQPAQLDAHFCLPLAGRLDECQHGGADVFGQFWPGLDDTRQVGISGKLCNPECNHGSGLFGNPLICSVFAVVEADCKSAIPGSNPGGASFMSPNAC